ncbi:MAG: proteasome-activating nucleotidase [Desulfurococcaceae archaeon]|jgi:proteasome regulatory subunit|nr:proteasome-activating nucleotidase [Desulfurococcaceae archaeon]
MSNGLGDRGVVERDDINVLINSDEDYVKYLELKIKQLEEERKRLLRRVEYYRSEIEKLLAPPLIEAYVEDLTPDGRVIVKSSSGPNLIVTIVNGVDISRLRPGSRVALNQRGSSIVEVLPDRVDPLVQLMEIVEKPSVYYSDIGGLSEQIQELREVVELPLKKPELFAELGIEPPKGVLLYGPPGCGKTLLAKAVATESNATFITLVGSELVQKYIGEGARLVRELFNYARKKAPTIVFIDEIDAIASRRLEIGTSGEREVQRTFMQLLAEIDGFKPLDRVKVIAATNRIDILDPALLRPGRLDRIIEVPLPSKSGRVEIFKIHLRRVKIKGAIDYDLLAEITEGFSGAEIKLAVVEAGYFAIREGRSYIVFQDLLKGVEKVKNKRTLRNIMYDTIRHEARLVYK